MDIFLLILFGVIAGVLGGMGMGGGTLLIPLLTIFLDIKQLTAQGINLLVFIPMAVVSLIFHFKNKLIEIKFVWIMMIVGVIGSIAGALLSTNLDDNILRVCFAVFLILLGIFQFISLFIFKNKENNKKVSENALKR